MFLTKMEVIVILSCHLQLQEDQKDARSLDLLRFKIWKQKLILSLLYSVAILVKNIGVFMLFLELWRIGEDDPDLHDGS